jgi:hypothetical protein
MQVMQAEGQNILTYCTQMVVFTWWRASANASDNPTGPPPTMKTGASFISCSVDAEVAGFYSRR